MCLVLLALGLGVALATTREVLAARRTTAAARQMAAALNALRWKSVALNRSHGMWFVDEGGGWRWYEVRDGNGNGLRTTELRHGVDRRISGPHGAGDMATGVRFGFPPIGAVPRIPPAAGVLDAPQDPVRFGRSDIVAFSPLGSASSGTLYVTDGTSELAAVVLFGSTSRARVWRYRRAEGRWTR
ncbi:MAG: hypothetical protein GY716_23970 [bacterium]|nr:hypothetical protein [bacterium]